MKLPFDQQELARAAIELCRDELSERLMAFRRTPLGKVTAKVGQRIIQAHQDGRKLDENDVVEICNDYASVIMTEDGEE